MSRGSPTGFILERLRPSHEDVDFISTLFRESGHWVSVPPMSEQRGDPGDLFVHQRIEVKRLTCDFTSEQDWPFADFIVCEVDRWEQAEPKPWAHLVLNQSRTALAMVLSAARDEWRVVSRWDSHYRRDIDFYVCDPGEVLWMSIADIRKANGMGLVRIGSLWKKKTKKGTSMLSGQIDVDKLKSGLSDLSIMVFPSDPQWKAQNEKRPDFSISVDEEFVEVGSEDDDIPF